MAFWSIVKGLMPAPIRTVCIGRRAAGGVGWILASTGHRLKKTVAVTAKPVKNKNPAKRPAGKSDADATGLIARCLADHPVDNAAAIAAAVLDRLVAAPEKVRVSLIRVLMADPQCLICGDLLD